MQLDRLCVELRRRNGFESLDLGFAMLRAWRAPVLRAWCITYWPVALLVSAALWAHPSAAFLVVWWLKPVLDRVLLHVYAGAMFGAAPSTRAVIRALPALLLRSRVPAALTFHRFGMARSLLLPVWQLEGQRGAAASARRRVLGARAYGYAAWLTFFCANMVSIWTLGGVMVLLALLPVESTQWLTWRDFFAWNTEWLVLAHATNLLAFAADTVIEPYFVAAGFSLYLNRRSDLEGWDLEVEFRRMTQRRCAPVAAGAGAALLVAALLMPWPDAQAAARPSAPPAAAALPFPAGSVKQEAKAVLDDPVFGVKETRARWVPRTRDDRTDGPAWWKDFLQRLARIGDAIARAGRVIVWVLGAAALAAAIYLVVRQRARWLRRNDDARRIPPALFGLDVRPDSLPADIVGAARAALAAGNAAAALGLLYRGALCALVHSAAVDLRPGDTEGECWRRAAPALRAGGADYFRRLLDAWLRTAYAHRPPQQAELQSLCEQWPLHFRREALVGTAR